MNATGQRQSENVTNGVVWNRYLSDAGRIDYIVILYYTTMAYFQVYTYAFIISFTELRVGSRDK